MEPEESIPTGSPEASNDCLGYDQRCPLCARPNDCRVAKGLLYKGPCWCYQIIVPNQVIARLSEDNLDPACLCRSCMEIIARVSGELKAMDDIVAKVRKEIFMELQEGSSSTELDYYLDAKGHTVFTAAYHVKRGSCCRNQCRHCPY